MARPLWKGSLTFGLVNIPIELHTAIRDHRPHFRMLHAKDKSPVRFERVCIRDGTPVAWEELVKGYEYSKGHFVVLTKEDFQAAALEKTRTVDIIDFVKAEEIDDRFFETPYYLVPAKGGERAYALLREAIRDSGRTGKGKLKGKEVELEPITEPRRGDVVDLMERLRKSLQQGGGKAAAAPTATRARAPKKSSARKRGKHAA